MRLVELSSQRSETELITELSVILHDKPNCFDSVLFFLRLWVAVTLAFSELTIYKIPQNLLVVPFADLLLAY